MRIWRLKISWVKRDRLGRPLHDWEQVTLDQLTEHARLLLTKMTRVAAQDFFEEQQAVVIEQFRAQLQQELTAHRAKLAVAVPVEAKKRAVKRIPPQTKEGGQ